jgi:hypothetical protein
MPLPHAEWALPLSEFTGVGELLLDDLVAQINALIADVDPWASDEFFDLLLRLTAERTLQQFARLTEFCHDWEPPLGDRH